MKVKEFEFERHFLKHTNFKNDYHVCIGMVTVSDKSGDFDEVKENNENVPDVLSRLNGLLLRADGYECEFYMKK